MAPDLDSPLSVRPVEPSDRDALRALVRERWSGDRVIVGGRTFAPGELPALVAEREGRAQGYLTYAVRGELLEIVTLDATYPRNGAGTALVEALVGLAARNGAERVTVTTTNDNLDALRFYQRRGFRLAALRPGAVDAARVLKPTIPLTGELGIPLRDEIDLVREVPGV